ncbi:MAG: nickel-dependent lactate racemase [Bacteroidetes bacterium]|nr:nickel-dependent lactate racemase [Bacteroidota bacterium]
MTDKLNYGWTRVPLDLGKVTHVDYLSYTNPSADAPDLIVQAALLHASVPLSAFIEPGCSVAIVVSDHTRPTGSDIYVPMLLKELQRLKAGSITLIIALGLHRPANSAEIQTICGGELPTDVRVVNHDAEKFLAGSGTAEFNQDAVNADRVIVTGAVTFHPMAGFSGGRKSLLPGIASSKDIYQNHRLYFNGNSVHTGTGPAKIDNNPVLNDIRERTKGFAHLWALNVVLNEQNRIEFASCGKVDSVWDDCRKYVSVHHSVEIVEKYDVVISSAGGYPSDCSFYQSMKVLTNSSRACKPGGTLIIISQCSHGWEIRDELFSYFTMTLEEISQNLQRSFTMDGLALYMALSIIRSYTVWFYSDLPESEVEAAGMRCLKNIGDIFAVAERHGNLLSIRTAVMQNGSSVLPINTESLRELL